MEKIYDLHLDELNLLAKEICSLLPKSGGVVVLQGDLASGKTTLTQAFAKYLGVKESVTSPTFSLQQCYTDRLFHYDLYNKGFEHFLSLGLLEELEKDGYHLIEWGDEKLFDFLKSAGVPAILIDIQKAENSRKYRIN